MTETLYRPHAGEGTHFCESKTNDEWIYGSTLDDETGKPHGTLHLEPVEVDTGSDDIDGQYILLAALFGAAVYVFDNRKEIIDWANETALPTVKRAWNKATGRKASGADCPDETDVSKIINFSDYRSSAHIDAQQAEENVVIN